MIMAINLNTFQWKKHEMALNKMPCHELKINGAINPCFSYFNGHYNDTKVKVMPITY